MTDTLHMEESLIAEEEAPSKIPAIIAIIAVLLSVSLASSPLSQTVEHFFSYHPVVFPALSIHGWVNEGLMAIFFLLVAIELKEALSDINKANVLYPLVGASFGMIFPALIFCLASILKGTSIGLGWAVPTTTDIAFALALLSFFPKLPASLRQFVLFLAVFDDLMGLGILVALFQGLPALTPLLICAGLCALGVILNLTKIKYTLVWAALTVGLWFALLNAHLFPEIAGLFTGVLMPKKAGHDLEKVFAKFTAFIIIPVFAFTSTFINAATVNLDMVTRTSFIGVFCGLLIGKPLGVTSAIYLLERCKVPAPWGNSIKGVKRRAYAFYGIGCACGIGFTMSLFFAGLSFHHAHNERAAEVAVLLASVGSGLLAAVLLKAANFKKS